MWFIEGLVSKSSGPVLAILQDIISLCKKFGHKVHIFMSDRGTEYTAAATSAYIAIEGMLRQFSVPHRQDQNHYPERAWRTIQGKVSSMLSRSGNGTSYWLLAMRSVVYLHNREGPPGRSPYERFFRMAPVVPPRHPFGSLALAVKPKGLLRKLHSRVRRCIHVGYDTHGKGAYLLEDMHTGRLLVRLDVSSYDIFPFRTHAQMGLVRDLVETVELTSPANDPLPRQPDVEEENHDPEVHEEAKRQEPVENGPDLEPDSMVHEQPAPVVGDEVRGRQRGGLRRSSRVRTAAHGSTGTTDEYQAQLVLDQQRSNFAGSTAESDHKWQAPPERPRNVFAGLAHIPSWPDFGRKHALPHRGDLEEYVSEHVDFDQEHVMPRHADMEEKMEDDLPVKGDDEVAFVAMTSTDDEPADYPSAMLSVHRKNWVAAVKEEIAAQEENSTWTVEILPTGTKTIGSRWVFKIKRGRDGKPTRFKARLVAKGFSQVEGLHYQETFAPTLKLASLRFMLAAATFNNWTLRQLDVTTAFLIAKLPESETIYMRPPPPITVPKGCALKLQRCIYGLKQASRHWNSDINATLLRHGFEPSPSDPCLYIRNKASDHGKSPVVDAYIALYTDDVIIAAPAELLESIANTLKRSYKMTDSGIPEWLLGIAIDIDTEAGTLRISQPAYVIKMLTKYGMTQCHTAKTPAAPDRLTAPTTSPTKEESDFMVRVPFRNAVGALMYLMVATRPDIAFAVIQVAKFVNDPRKIHWTAVKRIFRYLRGTSEYGITYTRGETFNLEGYSDSDWGGDLDTRKSTTGYLFMVIGGLVSWKCKLQRLVTVSSTEAELVAVNDAVHECVWFRKALYAMGFDITDPTTIFEDNQGCIAISSNQRGMSSRTKHVETRYFAVRQHVDSGAVTIVYCPTVDMLADIFTKPLGAVAFTRLRDAMGITSTDDNAKTM